MSGALIEREDSHEELPAAAHQKKFSKHIALPVITSCKLICNGLMGFGKFGLIESQEKFFLNVLIFIANVFLTPILLVYHSLRIYLLPCFSATMVSCLCRTLSSSFCLCCFTNMLYTDKDFLPNQSSLGAVSTKKKISWKRASEIQTKSTKLNQLFASGISIDDICQGQLGDCWLLSAITSLSSQPINLSKAFLSKEFNPRGKYTFRLWDPVLSKFVRISIDDYIPVDESGDPIFVRPNGNEIWVMLLEKVIAKFMGNYGLIEAGHPIFAMNILTGQQVCKYVFRNTKWNRTDMKVSKDEKGIFKISFFLNGDAIDNEAMYDIISKYSRSLSLPSSSSSSF